MPNRDKHVFVFGSNLAGRHGKGAALTAVNDYGAVYGQAEGLQGRSYAIPTRDGSLRTLSLHDIEHNVRKFLTFARAHPDLEFMVTAVGCGLAGYKPANVAPMFRDVPANVKLPKVFLNHLGINDLSKMSFDRDHAKNVVRHHGRADYKAPIIPSDLD